MEKLITKSFKRLLDKGIHRGFITYEELGKSLGKRHFSQQNVESAFLHIFDNKISLVEKKSDYSASKKRESLSSDTQKNKDLELSQIQKYKDSKIYLDDLIKNKTSKLKLPEGLKDYSQNEETFSIEEFNFNLMPGPFLDGLDITKDLLENNNLDNIFN